MIHVSSRSKLLICILSFLFFIIYCVYTVSYTTARLNEPDQNEPSQSEPFLNEPIKVIEKPQPMTESDVCQTAIVSRNTDPNHTRAHLNFWRSLSQEMIVAYREQWKSFMGSIKGVLPDMKGKGIVLVAGNRDTFQRALTTIELLRNMHHSDLAVEVWHLSDEHPSDSMVESLLKLNAVTRDLSDPSLPRPIQHRRDADKQFQIKAAAIINSSFKEVLYLDSDNIPTKDPAFLFETPEYKNTGALFWPDFWKTHGENKIFDVLQITCHDEWEQESGQMVIDKVKSWSPLQLAWYMQNEYEIYFQFLNGDKDTFKYAWQALDAPYHMTVPFLGMAGVMAGDRFCGHTMLQYYPTQTNDELLFVHANLLKITDKKHFIKNNEQHPWDFAKRSTFSHSNTWIKAEFYISAWGQACMDFTHREGEPDAITENFDSLLPNLQTNYFRFGGIGGETRN